MLGDFGGILRSVLPVLGMIFVLIWGLRLLNTVLMSRHGARADRVMMVEALSEKTEGGQEATSFSRVSGAIGAIALASFFTGLGLWILLKLDSEKANDIPTLLNGIWNFIWAGAALFAPYAFNQIGRIFGK